MFYNQVQNICAADPTLKPGETLRLWQDFYIGTAIMAMSNADLSKGLTVSYTVTKVLDDRKLSER